ncbi:MAG: carboxypeptidase Taq [Halovenus sp.]|jgi:carboxypeptidase Taq
MATTETNSDTPTPYEQLLERNKRITTLGDAAMHLHWDEQVVMPTDGTPARAKQQGAISKTIHELLVDDEVGSWLDAIDESTLTGAEAANVREIRRAYERETGVPADLTEELSQVGSENQQVWREAKTEDDYDRFAPRLERLRDLQRERAGHVDPGTDPYEVLYEDSNPYVPIETIEDIFETLRSELPPLIEEIRRSETDLADPWEGEYPEADQRALSEAVLDVLGYDRDRGRLDTAPHPFMAGTQFDARVTTRFKPTDPLDALTATIHEYGHASYQLGLRQDAYGTPLGQPRSSGVHESQSRFWENHIGRTRPFWEQFLPTFNSHVDGHDDLTVQQAYEAVNRVDPNNLIRVEADELTYHMHIILRCELGRRFVEGDLDAGEIPQVWNEKMDEYLGVVPETDSEGCLQDIHWTSGFAAFHGYTIGSVLAAQLNAAIREDLDVDTLVREREFDPIREWMGERVHRQGQRYTTPELVEEATGEALTAEYFTEYVREKFERLYDL